MYASIRRAALRIPPLSCWISNELPLSGNRTLSDGQFDWGGRLLKSIGGAQSYPQDGWKSSLRVQRQKGD